jgi:predicted nucleic acid-binding protein
LILIDTSVWIDFFSSSPGRAGHELRRMIEEADPFALTGVVIAEVLQGLKRDAHRIELHLSLWEMLEPLGFSTYSHAASISRLGRSRGVSLTTIDTVIAAIAIERDAVLFTLDKDFTRIARFTQLRLYGFPDVQR